MVLDHLLAVERPENCENVKWKASLTAKKMSPPMRLYPCCFPAFMWLFTIFVLRWKINHNGFEIGFGFCAKRKIKSYLIFPQYE